MLALKCKKRNLALNIEKISGFDDSEDVLYSVQKQQRRRNTSSARGEKHSDYVKKYSSPEYQMVVR